MTLFTIHTGTTAQEIDFNPAAAARRSYSSQADMNQYITSKLDSFEESLFSSVLPLYSQNHDPGHVFSSLGSDIKFNCPNNQLAMKAAHALKSPVYRFIVTSWPSQPIRITPDWNAKYAFHAWPTFAMFDILEAALPYGLNQSDRDFKDNLFEQVLAFVKTGKPKDERWLPFPQNTALLADEVDYSVDYHEEQCDIFLSKGIV